MHITQYRWKKLGHILFSWGIYKQFYILYVAVKASKHNSFSPILVNLIFWLTYFSNFNEI